MYSCWAFGLPYSPFAVQDLINNPRLMCLMIQDYSHSNSHTHKRSLMSCYWKKVSRRCLLNTHRSFLMSSCSAHTVSVSWGSEQTHTPGTQWRIVIVPLFVVKMFFQLKPLPLAYQSTHVPWRKIKSTCSGCNGVISLCSWRWMAPSVTLIFDRWRNVQTRTLCFTRT